MTSSCALLANMRFSRRTRISRKYRCSPTRSPSSTAAVVYPYEVGNLKVPNYHAKLYAVAINNTVDPEDAAVSRYVASTYDVAATYKNYYPATSLDALFQWTLDNKEKYGTTEIGGTYNEFGKNWLDVIHNRWVYNYAETNPGIRSYDQRNAYTSVPEAMEKRWRYFSTTSDDYKAGLRFPTAAEPTKSMEKDVKGTKKYNTENDDNDDRFNSPYLTIANVGDPIKVKLTEYLQSEVEYWYISYDFELNAVESKPSEWEAWQSIPIHSSSPEASRWVTKGFTSVTPDGA